jgi:hypothetical protein
MSRARERLADVAGRRARGWATLAQAFDEPDPELLEALTSRSIFGDLAEAIGWMDSGRSGFLPHVALLDTFAQRAARDPEGTLRELRAEHARLFGDPAAAATVAPVGEMRSLAAMCARERHAWASADEEHAKTLRLGEHAFIRSHLTEPISRLCDLVLESGESDLYRAAAGILREMLRLESGGDYATSVLRGVFPDGGA